MEIMNQVLDQVFPMLFREYSALDNKPFDLTDYKECVLFYALRALYQANMSSASLRTYLLQQNAEDDERLRMERLMRYSQHYMAIHHDLLLERYEIEENRLRPVDMSEMQNKLAGYKISPLQFEQLNTMGCVPLLKAITSKRICSAKSISNEKLESLIEEYDCYIDSLYNRVKDDEDMVFYSILAYDLESAYAVDFLYAVTCEAEKHGFPEPPIDKLISLCGELELPMPAYFAKKLEIESAVIKSDFVKHRIDLIPLLFNEEWISARRKIYPFLWFRFSYVKMGFLDDMPFLDFFNQNTTLNERAVFLQSQYNLLQNRVKKQWNSKRIRYFRKLYSLLYTNMKKPQIK